MRRCFSRYQGKATPPLSEWRLAGFHGTASSPSSTENASTASTSPVAWQGVVVKDSSSGGGGELGAGLYIADNPFTPLMYAASRYTLQSRQHSVPSGGRDTEGQDIEKQEVVDCTPTASSPDVMPEVASPDSSKSAEPASPVLLHAVLYRRQSATPPQSNASDVGTTRGGGAAGVPCWLEPIAVPLGLQWDKYDANCIETLIDGQTKEEGSPVRDSAVSGSPGVVLFNGAEVPAMVRALEDGYTTPHTRGSGGGTSSCFPSQYKVHRMPTFAAPLADSSVETEDFLKQVRLRSFTVDEAFEIADGDAESKSAFMKSIDQQLPHTHATRTTELPTGQGHIHHNHRHPHGAAVRVLPDGDCFFSAVAVHTQLSPMQRWNLLASPSQGQPHSQHHSGDVMFASKRDVTAVKRVLADWFAVHRFGMRDADELTAILRREGPSSRAFDVSSTLNAQGSNTASSRSAKMAHTAEELELRWNLVTEFGGNTGFLRPTFAETVAAMRTENQLLWGDAELLAPAVVNTFRRDVVVWMQQHDGAAAAGGGGKVFHPHVYPWERMKIQSDDDDVGHSCQLPISLRFTGNHFDALVWQF